MADHANTSAGPRRAADGSTGGTITGAVVFVYAFDIAYDMTRTPVRELLGQPVAQYVVDASKRTPRHMTFYSPQMVRLTPLERLGPAGPLRLERTIKLLPVGAISITVRVPFAVGSLGELVTFHDLRFADGVRLTDEVHELAEQVKRELASYYVRPLERVGAEEAYTVFCIADGLADLIDPSLDAERSAEHWLQTNRRHVAAMLTEEPDAMRLSDQEVEESTNKSFSYYNNDIVVIDWDAALVVEPSRNFDQTLHVIELANLQLAELEAYDRILDDAVERAYRDLSVKRVRGRPTTIVQRELREIRIDLARFSDELSNITKFFGDWHLARVYQGLADRFHLSDWHRTIDEKLRTLDQLYQFLHADQMNRWMLILEATIVLLFVLDIVMLLWRG